MRLDWIFLPRENPCAKFYIIIIIIIIIKIIILSLWERYEITFKKRHLKEIGIVNSSGGIRTMQNLHFLDRPPFAERSLKIKTRRNFTTNFL